MDNKQALQVIDEMITSAKADIKDNGFFYLIWGWLILIAIISEYILLFEVQSEYHWIGWPITSIIGAIAASIGGRKMNKEAKVKTHFDRMMSYVWGGFGVTLFLILFSMNVGNPAEGVYPLIIALYSLCTFISGGLLKYKPLKVGAIISWCLAMTAMFVDFKFQLLLFAISIIAAYLIPGYLLRSKYNKQ